MSTDNRLNLPVSPCTKCGENTAHGFLCEKCLAPLRKKGETYAPKLSIKKNEMDRYTLPLLRRRRLLARRSV